MVETNDRASGFLDRASGIENLAPGALSKSAAGGDPLASVLRNVRLTGALFFFVDATSPWCVEVPDTGAYADLILPHSQHVLSYHIVVEGKGFAAVPGAEPVMIEAGDIIVFPLGDAYQMFSAPDAPPELDGPQTVQFFKDLAAGRLPFVIPEGGGADPPAKFICGFLGCDLRPFNPVLAGLPRLVHLKRRDRAQRDLLDQLIDLTMQEVQEARAGGDPLRLRLSEAMFVELLRRYAASDDPQKTGWLAGLRDPSIARALEVLHRDPARGWTLAELARETGVSRSVLAERFQKLTGHPPMHYLTLWRMQMAAHLLAEGTATIAEISHRVGYGSEAAFSRTFKKFAGASPALWRREAAPD